jgi:hypothetical protein
VGQEAVQKNQDWAVGGERQKASGDSLPEAKIMKMNAAGVRFQWKMKEGVEHVG